MKFFFQIDALDRAIVTKLLNALLKGVSLMLTFDAEMKSLNQSFLMIFEISS